MKYNKAVINKYKVDKAIPQPEATNDAKEGTLDTKKGISAKENESTLGAGR
jgi:hypothetical protein